MPLTSIDLFAGAGGISEGLKEAGYKCLYGNDCNKWAIATFERNHPKAWVDPGKIEDVDAKIIRKKLGLKPRELALLAGGPPCQGFSINAPERFPRDPRNVMFRHYMRFLDEFKPQAFLFENVPGMLSLGKGYVFESIMKQFQDHGYNVSAKILFSAHYGVPQKRWRLIILGSLSAPAPIHPPPTHYASGRTNFRGGGNMTFHLGPKDKGKLKHATTVHQAISDLPRLRMGDGDEIINYTKQARSNYAKAMRNGDMFTYNHLAGKLSPQNVERMKYVKPGGSWRDIPHHLLPKGMQRARSSDHTMRYGRLKKDNLAGTVMTKCDPHWGAVFLPDQDRALTVREAARLQSFPDNYRFLGPRVAQYEQVGNAVPVLMVKAIGEAIKKHLLLKNHIL